jgi:ABC-type cobalt transport system substrate-binding protein
MSLVIIPVALSVWGMTLYNTARFGSPTEFGIKYSIIGSDHSEVAQRVRENKMTGLSYLALNTIQLAVLRPFWTNEDHHIVYYNRPGWLIGSYPRLVDDEFVSSIFFSSPLLLFFVYTLFVIRKNKKNSALVLILIAFLVSAYIYGGLSMAYARRYIQDYYAFLILLTFAGMVLFWKDYIVQQKKQIQYVVVGVVCLLIIFTAVIAFNLNCQVAFTLDMKRCVNIYNLPPTFEPLSNLLFIPKSGSIHTNI